MEYSLLSKVEGYQFLQTMSQRSLLTSLSFFLMLLGGTTSRPIHNKRVSPQEVIWLFLPPAMRVPVSLNLLISYIMPLIWSPHVTPLLPSCHLALPTLIIPHFPTPHTHTHRHSPLASYHLLITYSQTNNHSPVFSSQLYPSFPHSSLLACFLHFTFPCPTRSSVSPCFLCRKCKKYDFQTSS